MSFFHVLSRPLPPPLSYVVRPAEGASWRTPLRYPLTGFDPSGEPMVRWAATGRLWLCVEFFPPLWVPEEERAGPVSLGAWADFDQRLARAIGVPVVWEDREWFRIDHPREDTVSAIQRFLLAERARLDPTPPEINQLDDTLRRWAAGAAVLSAEEVAAKKARLRQLSLRAFFRLFPHELGRAAEPPTAPDPAGMLAFRSASLPTPAGFPAK